MSEHSSNESSPMPQDTTDKVMESGFRNPRELLSKWLEESKGQEEDELRNDWSHQFRNGFSPVQTYFSNVLMAVERTRDEGDKEIVAKIETSFVPFRKSAEVLLDLQKNISIGDLEILLNNLDDSSNALENTIRDLIDTVKDPLLREAIKSLERTSHIPVAELLEMSLKGVEKDKKISIETTFNGGVSNILSDLKNVNLNRAGIKQTSILKVLSGSRSKTSLESFGPDDEEAIELFYDMLKEKGIDIKDYLKNQGFEGISSSSSDDIMVSERVYRRIIGPFLEQRYVDALKNIATIKEGEEFPTFDGSVKIDITQEEGGRVINFTYPVKSKEADRLATLERKKIDVPSSVEDYKYHMGSSYFQQLIFDRYQKNFYLNDFTLTSDADSGRKTVTYRMPIIE